VLGVSRLYRRILYPAVERIRSVEFVLDPAEDRVRFTYLKGYRPEKHLGGAFGLLDGPETHVELLLLADTEAYLRHRIIHPTQKFPRRRDGKTVLTMKVRGTDELRDWILGFGPWLRVLKPDELRDEVHSLLAEGAALYRQSIH
jgi:hypothetical protein